MRILTSKAKVGPSRDWLQAEGGYVVTAAAREKIRQWFRRQQRDEMIAQGREILDRELRRLSIESKSDEILKHFPTYQKVDDFLAAIGYGAVSPQQIVARVGETRKDEFTFPTERRRSVTPARVDVMGAGGSADEPGVLLQAGDGRSDHRLHHPRPRHHGSSHDCPNLINIPDPERLVPVGWGNQGGSTFPVAARISAWDRVGLLKDVSTLLADEKVNILSAAHDDARRPHSDPAVDHGGRRGEPARPAIAEAGKHPGCGRGTPRDRGDARPHPRQRVAQPVADAPVRPLLSIGEVLIDLIAAPPATGSS